MAKLSAPAAAKITKMAATLLKGGIPSKPLPMPKAKAGRAPSGKATAANMKSGYAK